MTGFLNSQYLQRMFAIISVGIISFCWLCWSNVSIATSASVTCGAVLVLFVLWFVEYRFYPIQERRKGKSENFDWGMHYLRGFAILCIMIMHILARFGLRPFTAAFFNSSTVYFLFISGYLCQYLALKRPVVDREYYKKKLQNVILPYIIMSAVTLIMICLIDAPRVGSPKPNSITLLKLPEIFLFGWAQNPYWYIPFVTLLFIVSPKLSRISTKALIWATIIAFACAIVFPSRGGSKFTPSIISIASKYTYFTFYYLVGFLYARLKKNIDPQLKYYAIPALLLAILIGIAKLEPQFFKSAIISGNFANSFQKFLFLVPILVVAIALKKKKILILDALAEYSFALYFVHYFFIQDWMRIQSFICNSLTTTSSSLMIIINLILTVLFVLQCLVWAVICKYAIGRWSRAVLGV